MPEDQNRWQEPHREACGVGPGRRHRRPHRHSGQPGGSAWLRRPCCPPCPPPPPRPLLTPFHPSRWRPFPTLSGGQQALASLALAFAMQSAFPSPFCFFDEVMGERGRRTPAAFPPPPPAALGWGPPDMEHCISLVPA